MSIIKLETKNIKTLSVLTLIAALGAALLTWFTKANYFSYGYSEYSMPNPYLTAFQPILYVALPILLVITFVFGIIVATRDELPKSRWQASFFTFVILLLAYICSFMMTNQGFGY